MPYDPNSLMPRYRSWEDPMTGVYLQHLVARQRQGDFRDPFEFVDSLKEDRAQLSDPMRSNAMMALFNVFARQRGDKVYPAPAVHPTYTDDLLPRSPTFEDEMIKRERRKGRL